MLALGKELGDDRRDGRGGFSKSTQGIMLPLGPSSHTAISNGSPTYLRCNTKI